MKYQDDESIIEHNQKLFDKFRELNKRLDLKEYAIVSGGPLAVRGIKKTGDVDVVVGEPEWSMLLKEYKVTRIESDRTEIIRINDDIDILHFPPQDKYGPSAKEQIRKAETKDGLRFQSLDDCIRFKKIMAREKDKKDLKLLRNYLNHHPEEAIKVTIKI